MDEQAWYDRLETTAEGPDELFEHFESRAEAGVEYHALPDGRHNLERGTVIVDTAEDGAVVRGFPSIPRILALEAGIGRFFDPDDAIAVEEKLNGFNVRIVDVGEILAFTRGGYVCPYTTGRARELLDPAAFFTDHPEKMLCAELVGPETPYTPHDYEEVDSHAFRVFGIRDRETGVPVPVAERRARCAEYGFEQVPFFGWYDPESAVAGVRETIDDLDARHREGVVLKSADADHMVKYTTGSQHHRELAYAFSLPFEYGRDFVYSRLLREAFQAAEFEDDEDHLRERARHLGESILLPMIETIRDVEAGETVGERHTVRGDHDLIESLLVHLNGFSLTVEVEDDRREGEDRVVEFVKVANSTRDHVEYYLDGGTRDE